MDRIGTEEDLNAGWATIAKEKLVRRWADGRSSREAVGKLVTNESVGERIKASSEESKGTGRNIRPAFNDG
jgi:hypothetical protein